MKLYQIFVLLCLIVILILDQLRIYRMKQKMQEMVLENEDLLHQCRKDQNALGRRYMVLYLWLKAKITGRDIWDDILESDEVILYGITDLGYLLYLDLRRKKKVLAIVDKRGCGKTTFGESVQIISAEELARYQDKKIPIIVTPIAFYEEIEKDLAELGFDTVVSLENCF